MKKTKIAIRDDFREDWISRAAGERLRLMILQAALERGVVEIDFKDVTVASTSFFDEGIAKLALEGWSRGDFDKRVVLRNVNPRDERVLAKMCAYRGLGE